MIWKFPVALDCILSAWMAVVMFSTIISADSYVICSLTLFIWPLFRLIAFNVATAPLLHHCASLAVLHLGCPFHSFYVLLWPGGGYTRGSWVTTRLAPTSVIICVTSLCRVIKVCLVLPAFRSLVPHRRTTVTSWSWVQLSRAQALASVSVGARWF